MILFPLVFDLKQKFFLTFLSLMCCQVLVSLMIEEIGWFY
uniref:Uncharacterized protein n=1 Tax=Rhizophora mucronata TaxID=61149 RepID=A0A2P2LK00_RHIMU